MALYTQPFDDGMADGGKWLSRRVHSVTQCGTAISFLPLPDEVVTHHRLPTLPSTFILERQLLIVTL